jgi:hypothetical protein
MTTKRREFLKFAGATTLTGCVSGGGNGGETSTGTDIGDSTDAGGSSGTGVGTSAGDSSSATSADGSTSEAGSDATTEDPPVPIPAWVPPPGEVAILTQSNGGLLNRFIDQCAPYFSPFYYVNTVNDFSGAFKNPYWGTLGATVFWGGGHAGTNDNTVTVAEYREEGIAFIRVSDPTPWFGTGTDEGTQFSNSRDNANGFLDFEYMESTIDGQPGSPHSYCCGDVIGPQYGGAEHGSLLQVASAAVNHANDAGAIAAHQIDFDTTELTTSAGTPRKWVRVTDNTPSGFGPSSAPYYTAFVGSQQRVYILTNGGGVPGLVRWFDREDNTYQTGAGLGFDIDEADGFDSGTVFWVPERELLVCMYPVGGGVRVQWMDVSVAQPTLGGTATLSEPLALTLPWSAGCWCPDNARIIIVGVAGDDTAAYELEIPADPSATWTVTRAPFGRGQTLTPADPALGIGLTYKKFQYDEKVRAIVYMPLASRDGDDVVYVYRPRDT